MYNEDKTSDDNTIKLSHTDAFDDFVERVRAAWKLYDDKNIQKRGNKFGILIDSNDFIGLQNLYNEIRLLKILRYNSPKESYLYT